MLSLIRQYPAWTAFLLLMVIGRLLSSSYFPLTDFSEARYAEMARKIVELNDWITVWFTTDLPFWGKPPLAFWTVAVSFIGFGVNEFAARLPSFLATLATSAVIYQFVRTERDSESGLIAASLYLACWIVVHSAGAVITDPLLSLTTTMVMVGFWRGIVNDKAWGIWLMWSALGLGLMTKGPIALVLSGLACGAWVALRVEWKTWWQRVRLIRGLALMCAIALPWYVLAEIKTPGFIDYFLVGEHWLRYTTSAWSGDLYGGVKDQPHGTIWAYLFVALLPFSPIVLYKLMTKKGRAAASQLWQQHRSLTIYLLCWLLTPAIFFTFGKNILISYVLTAIPAAAILIALNIDQLLVSRQRFYPFIIISTALFFSLNWIAYEGYAKDHRYNQKPVVEVYQEMNALDPGKLIYWGAPRFSVIFYTENNVTFPGPKVHEHLYDETVYHAVRDMWINSIASPPWNERCEKIFYHGEYTLLYCPAVKSG